VASDRHRVRWYAVRARDPGSLRRDVEEAVAGGDWLRHSASRNAGTPRLADAAVIVLTVDDTPEAGSRLRLGATAHLRIPVDQQALINAIAEALAGIDVDQPGPGPMMNKMFECAMISWRPSEAERWRSWPRWCSRVVLPPSRPTSRNPARAEDRRHEDNPSVPGMSRDHGGRTFRLRDAARQPRQSRTLI